MQALGRERLVAVEDPCYEKIRQVYRAHGIRTESLRLGDKGILTEELKRAGARVLHVTPFHSYPSGITANASKRREYIRWAEERFGLIIEDDFDSEFTLLSKAEDTLFSLAPHGPVVYMNTFSRTIAPSVRVAYLVLPENRLSRFQERTGFYSCTVPVLDQLILAELISHGDFERHINRVRRRRRRKKETAVSSGK